MIIEGSDIPTLTVKPKVLVSYHFFAHYRQSIVDSLSLSSKFDFMFAGDLVDPANSGVKAYVPTAPATFIPIRCRAFLKVCLWQPKLAQLAFKKDISAYILLGNMYMPWTWIAMLICKLRGKRVLLWTHGWREKEQGLKGRLRVVFYRLADGLLVYEHHAKSIAIDLGFDPDSVYVVYNSLDMSEQLAAEKMVTVGDVDQLSVECFGQKRPTVIFSGRLNSNRKLSLLMDAMHQLQSRNIELNLLIVGDGPERENYEQAARDHKLNAYFTGAVYDEKLLAKYFKMSDVCVCPGPAGLAVIHTFTYGVPIIVSDQQSIQGPEWGAVIPGKNGDYFENDSAKSLANVIHGWINGDVARAQVAAECKKVVETAYNSRYQVQVIEAAVSGEPANDLLRSQQIRQ